MTPTPTSNTASDPGSAVRTTKFAPAEPGLPNQPASDVKGRKPMVRTTNNFAGLRPGGRVPHLSLHLPPEWTRDALCAQVDPELWFPDKGGSTRPAKRICRDCPVLAECRDYALARGDLDGVWGGLSERERRRLRGHARRTRADTAEPGRAAA